MQIDRKKVENYAKKDRNQTRFRSRRGNLPPRVKVGATQLAAFKNRRQPTTLSLIYARLAYYIMSFIEKT